MRMCHFSPEYNRILAECYMTDSDFREKLDSLCFDRQALINNLIKHQISLPKNWHSLAEDIKKEAIFQLSLQG